MNGKSGEGQVTEEVSAVCLGRRLSQNLQDFVRRPWGEGKQHRVTRVKTGLAGCLYVSAGHTFDGRWPLRLPRRLTGLIVCRRAPVQHLSTMWHGLSHHLGGGWREHTSVREADKETGNRFCIHLGEECCSPSWEPFRRKSHIRNELLAIHRLQSLRVWRAGYRVHSDLWGYAFFWSADIIVLEKTTQHKTTPLSTYFEQICRATWPARQA